MGTPQAHSTKAPSNNRFTIIDYAEINLQSRTPTSLKLQ